MDRTFNTFIDNGMFIAAKLLNTIVDDLNIDSIRKNQVIFSEYLLEGLENDKNIKSSAEKMFTHNSFLNNALKKGTERIDKINMKMNLLLKNYDSQEKEICILCGKKSSVKDVQATRSDIPAITSNTFLNYSNNLQYVNVCPECMFFTILSLFNTVNAGYLIQLNSDSVDVMEEWTNYKMDIFEYPEKPLGTYEYIKLLIKHITNTVPNVSHKYLCFTLFCNLGQKEYYKKVFISAFSMNLLYKFKENNLLNEFLEIYPLWILRYSYADFLDKIISFTLNNFNKLTNRKELISIMVNNLSDLEESTDILISKIANKLLTIPKVLEHIKKVNNYIDFIDLLTRWQLIYKSTNDSTLFDNMDEYNALINSKKWRYIKNKLITQLIILT